MFLCFFLVCFFLFCVFVFCSFFFLFLCVCVCLWGMDVHYVAYICLPSFFLGGGYSTILAKPCNTLPFNQSVDRPIYSIDHDLTYLLLFFSKPAATNMLLKPPSSSPWWSALPGSSYNTFCELTTRHFPAKSYITFPSLKQRHRFNVEFQ